MKSIILNLNGYNFTNETTGELIQGAKIAVLSPFNFNDNLKGNEVIYYSLSLDDLRKFNLNVVKFPCVAEIETISGKNASNRVILKVINVEVLKEDLNLFKELK